MTDAERRTVGDDGQVTLPKHLREEVGIQAGDEVTLRERGGKILVEKSVSREELAEDYRRHAGRHRELAEEMNLSSQEANDHLGTVPEWDE